MTTIARICLGAAMLAALACSPSRESDRRTLVRLRAEYGSTLDLSVRNGMYLMARARTDAGVQPDVLNRIFVAFVGDSTVAVGSTGIVYLNYYDRRGHFMWQIYRDKGRIVKSQQEFY